MPLGIDAPKLPRPFLTDRYFFITVRRLLRRARLSSAIDFHLDILPERRYLHLEWLPKNNENASNSCREPWTC
jgi:hypothetical protein